MIPWLQNKSFKKRLNELNLFNLSKRRQRGDLIEVFKIFYGFDNISLNDYVTTDLTYTTRNNGFKINGKRFRSNEAKHFYFYRIANILNSLTAQIVNSITIGDSNIPPSSQIANSRSTNFSQNLMKVWTRSVQGQVR